MAKPKTRVSSLDDVSEDQVSLRSLYRAATDGEGEGFVLDLEAVGGFALEDVSGLRSALERSRNVELRFETIGAAVSPDTEQGLHERLGPLWPRADLERVGSAWALTVRHTGTLRSLVRRIVEAPPATPAPRLVEAGPNRLVFALEGS